MKAIIADSEMIIPLPRAKRSPFYFQIAAGVLGENVK
jgi:hypothetical protein